MASSSFDLGAFAALFPGLETSPRDCLAQLAKTAEQAERYEEMCKFMREMIVTKDTNLSEEERNLLSVAYKNVIGARRASWRVLIAEKAAVDKSGSEVEKKLDNLYVEQIEKELKKVCDDVLDLLNAHLIPAAEAAEDAQEASVFYLKMAGDYCRYKAESSDDQEDKLAAGKFYERAYAIAQEHLTTTHPIRLGLALNYSVCFYEILKDKKKACDLAKTAFDDAISKLDKLQTNEYKDSTLIMQLLRDNLTLWTSAEENPASDNLEVEEFSGED